MAISLKQAGNAVFLGIGAFAGPSLAGSVGFYIHPSPFTMWATSGAFTTISFVDLTRSYV
jgi:hypothetical protein